MKFDHIPSNSVAALFWNSVDRNRDHPAVISGGESLSYAQFDAAACRVANHLNRECPGQSENPFAPVALFLDHGNSILISVMGVRLSGRCYAPLDISFPEARLKTSLENIAPSAVITEDKYADLVQRAAPQGVLVLNISDLMALKDTNRPRADENPGSLAYLLSTSGTTGEPKGIAHDQKSVLRSAGHYSTDVGVTALDRIGLILPCTYTPSVFCIFGAFLHGATLCPFDLKSRPITELIDWIHSEQITLLYSSPTIFRRLIGECDDPQKLASLRSVQLAGEPLFRGDVDQYRRRFGDMFSLYNGMGTGECSCLTRFFIDADTQIDSDRVPIGMPYDDVTLDILDPDGNPSPVGEDGDLIVNSAYTSGGYWRRPDLSAEKFTDLGDGLGTMVYRTGDRARRLPDGNIVHLGREDDQIKVRGQRVELAEIEATMLRSGTATSSTVVFVQPPAGDPFIAAFFAPAGNVGEMRKFLSAQLPPFMIPTRLVALDAIPMGTSGKVDRKQLLNFDFERHDDPETKPTDGASNLSIIELRILECFKSVLKNEDLHGDSDFFVQGGDSLAAVELAIQLEDVLATPINVSSLIESPTPRKMAHEAQKSLYVGKTKNIVQFHDGRSEQDHCGAQPVFCLPGYFGDALSFRAFASEMVATRPVYALEYPVFEGAGAGFDTLEDLADICFDAITDVYPEGPIALVCYSAGGAVGFALSHKLIAAGREISQITMMDSYDPRGLKIRHLRDKTVRFAKKALGRAETEPLKLRYQAVNDAIGSAIFKYRPRPLAIDNMTLIVAQDDDSALSVFGNHKGWKRLLAKPFDIVPVRGSHLDLIFPEKAPEMVQIVNQSMPYSAGVTGDTKSTVRQMFDEIWSFNGSPDLGFKIIQSGDVVDQQRELLDTDDQLTSRLVAQVGERISAQPLTSRQIGRYYYRKVELVAVDTGRVAVVAAIRIAMDQLDPSAIKEIVGSQSPFGAILSNHAIEHRCYAMALLEIEVDAMLRQEMEIPVECDHLFGRKSRIESSDGRVLADVVEIIAPWV